MTSRLETIFQLFQNPRSDIRLQRHNHNFRIPDSLPVVRRNANPEFILQRLYGLHYDIRYRHIFRLYNPALYQSFYNGRADISSTNQCYFHIYIFFVISMLFPTLFFSAIFPVSHTLCYKPKTGFNFK